MRAPLHANLETPERAAAAMLRRLAALSDARRARAVRRFFKERDAVAAFGVPTPQVRRLARETARSYQGIWTPQEALRFAECLVQRPQIEAKFAGFAVLGRFVPRADVALAERAAQWMSRGWCGNWADIDSLCLEVLSPLARRDPRLFRLLPRWARSPNLWQRRASVVTLVPFARRGVRLALAYRLVMMLRKDVEDLIHKPCGWLLREAGKADPSRLVTFLQRSGHALPRTTVRYAIERFPQRQRRRLLETTRSR